MKQMTLSTGSFDRYAKMTRRAAFLGEMNRVVPWKQLCALIEPAYPKAENGRPPVGLERMLRIYFLQNWFNLSDPAVEEALYDSLSMREFVGVGVDSGCRAGGRGSCQTTIKSGEVAYSQAPDFDPEPGSCLLCTCMPKTNVTLEA